MVRAVFVGGVVFCLVLCGCVEDRGLAGDWVAEVEIDKEAAGTENDEIAADLAKTLAESMELKVSLNKDGSYAEQVLFYEVSGSWRMRNGDLVLSPKTVNGTKMSDVADAGARENLGAEKVFDVAKGRDSFSRTNPDGSYREVYRRAGG